MPRPGERTIRPFVREERDLDGQNREVRATASDLYRKLEEGGYRASRIMPADAFTRLWWPLNEVNEPTFHNEGQDRAPHEMLTPGATCGPTYGGLLWDTCARLYGPDATRFASGATGMTMGNAPQCALSCWFRASNSSGVNAIAFGYLSDGGTALAMLYADTARLPRFSVMTAAGNREVVAVGDSKVSDGQWHFLLGSYDGTHLIVCIDGVPTANTYPTSSPMDWTSVGGVKSWYLGFPGSANSGYGLIQDVRVHNVARPVPWAHQAWRRGMGLFGTEVRL